MARKRLVIEFSDEGDSLGHLTEVTGDALRRIEEGDNMEAPIQFTENGEKIRLDELHQLTTGEEEDFVILQILAQRVFDHLIYDDGTPEWLQDEYREDTELLGHDKYEDSIREIFAEDTFTEMFPSWADGEE